MDIPPHEPRIATAAIDGIGGQVGPTPDDFVVDEIPAYLPEGEGAHWMIRVQKRGWTTPAMVRALARCAGVQERDIGSAGMKDKHAVTTQWLTFPGNAPDPATWDLPDDIALVEVSRHNNKLRTGHLSGNTFRIRLVECATEEGAAERAEGIVAHLVAHGLPNYFGAQRFGESGRNVGVAVDWLIAGAPGQGKKTRLYRKLYPSVVQSEIFNRWLSARLDASADLLVGEVVRLEGSRSVFAVEDPAAEAPRLASGDIVPTGPMWGPKMRRAEGAAALLEEDAAASLGLTAEVLETLGRFAPGTRRDMLIRPESLRIEREVDGTFVLSFGLPSGGYATQLIRELTRQPWTADKRQS